MEPKVIWTIGFFIVLLAIIIWRNLPRKKEQKQEQEQEEDKS